MYNPRSLPEDETTLKVIRLWNEGFSASEVAMSCGLASRNVVIGKINRLLDKGDTRITRAKDTRPKRQRIIRENLHIIKAKVTPMPKSPPIPEPDNSLNITLLAVTEKQCRWIVGDSVNMICCGHPVEIGSSFCLGHRAIVYTKTPGTEEDRVKAEAASRSSASMRQFGG